MVHLARVKRDEEVNASLPKRIDDIKLDMPEDGDDFCSTVYGSRFAGEHLPAHEMPDREMPKEVAYRMIKDELSLDGNPMLNLASFVTTYMEEEVEKLMAESFSKNFIDYEEYPQSAEIQNRCINMIARLFNAPTTGDDEHPMGTSTIGSSEAIMLGTLAMKKRWQNKRKAEGKDFSRPNIVMNSAVQVCWEKAARYFDVEERYVYCTEQRFVIDPKEAVDLVDENTIGICAILGTTYTGEYEDVKAMNDILVERNIDCPIHVDAASGGFVAPFINPNCCGISVWRRSCLLTCQDTSMVWSTPVLAGLFGDPTTSCPRSSSSTSTTWVRNRPVSPSTSPRVPRRSSASTTR